VPREIIAAKAGRQLQARGDNGAYKGRLGSIGPTVAYRSLVTTLNSGDTVCEFAYHFSLLGPSGLMLNAMCLNWRRVLLLSRRICDFLYL